METRIAMWAGAVALSGLVGGDASAQGPGYPELARDEEIRLAMSAGPADLSAAADVWVMTEHGFERAVEGSNGFACLVVRSASLKSQLAPHCLSPAAVETVLPAFVREGELQAAGLEADEIAEELRRSWERGALPLPEGPAYAFMLSRGQRLGPGGGNFRPHFMLYVPYLTNADIGGDPARVEFPFVGPIEDHPLSTVVIVMEEFVDPARIELPGRR